MAPRALAQLHTLFCRLSGRRTPTRSHRTLRSHPPEIPSPSRQGEIDHPRPAPQVLSFDEPPVAGVFAVVPVVAENEEPPRRNHQGDPSCHGRADSLPHLPSPSRIVGLPPHGRMDGIAGFVQMDGVGLSLRNPIEEELLVAASPAYPRAGLPPVSRRPGSGSCGGRKTTTSPRSGSRIAGRRSWVPGISAP